MTWKIYKKSKQDWNEQFIISNAHYRQSHQWGEYKSKFGWKVIRLYKKDISGNRTLVQAIYKNFIFFTAVYIPGNIIGDFKQLDKEFKEKIQKETNSFFIYIRIDSNSKFYKEEEVALINNQWQRPLATVHTAMSIDCDLRTDNGKILQYRKKWNKSLKLSKNNNLKVEITNNPNSKILVEISSKMKKNKKIINTHSESEFSNLTNIIRDNCLFAIVRDLNGNNICYRGMIFFREQAWDFSAATSQLGRDSLASYLAMDKIFEKSRELGIKNYNLGGIDKINKFGVYLFKKGVGGEEFNYSGEYEWANFKFIKIIVNILIFLFMSERLRSMFPWIWNIKF